MRIFLVLGKTLSNTRWLGKAASLVWPHNESLLLKLGDIHIQRIDVLVLQQSVQRNLLAGFRRLSTEHAASRTRDAISYLIVEPPRRDAFNEAALLHRIGQSEIIGESPVRGKLPRSALSRGIIGKHPRILACDTNWP